MRRASLAAFCLVALAGCTGGAEVTPSPSQTLPEGALGSTVIGSTTYVFVPSEAGASTQFAKLYARSANGELQVVKIGNDDFRVPFGGSVTHGNGARCERDTLVVLGAGSTDGSTWTLTEDVYEMNGARATLKTQREERTIVDSSGEKIAPYYTIDCDGVVSLSD